ncbi:MAG: HAD-IA family hydrolase, partial [Promethearchaeota archaeon]
MKKIVEKLHKAGFIVSLMSNTFELHVKSNELRGFYKIFDHIFLSTEIKLRKPDLEKYKYVLKKLDTSPKSCIFIDDKLTNIITARQLGMYVIRFESIEKFKEQLKQLGIKKISVNLRYKIKEKYKKYKTTKKEYKEAKKSYKEARKDFLKKKKKSLKNKEKYQKRRINYEKKKLAYKTEKEKKKELEARIDVN